MKEIQLRQRTIDLDGKPFTYCFPWGDDTSFGTLAAVNEGVFRLGGIDFDVGDVFVDLGSNICLLSCIVAKTRPNVQVYAFDVNPLACLCGRINAIKNGLTNIQVFNKGIGKINKKGVVFGSNGKEVTASVLSDYDPLHKDKIVADVISIDEIFDSQLLGIDRVKYLKIDIEGGEFDVMNYVCDNRPDIIERIDHLHLEIHGFPGREELDKKVREKFGLKLL